MIKKKEDPELDPDPHQLKRYDLNSIREVYHYFCFFQFNSNLKIQISHFRTQDTRTGSDSGWVAHIPRTKSALLKRNTSREWPTNSYLQKITYKN